MADFVEVEHHAAGAFLARLPERLDQVLRADQVELAPYLSLRCRAGPWNSISTVPSTTDSYPLGPHR